MNRLVPLTIDAHGGFERWRRFEYATAHLRNGGVLWALKHQQGVLDDINVRVALRREWASHSPFLAPDLRTSFEPYRVAIEATDGRVVEERLQPRFGSDGLLRRHDYDADVLGGSPAAHYVHEYREFSGIKVPTKRRVLGRRLDGTPAPDPLIVTIDLSAVEFT